MFLPLTLDASVTALMADRPTKVPHEIFRLEPSRKLVHIEVIKKPKRFVWNVNLISKKPKSASILEIADYVMESTKFTHETLSSPKSPRASKNTSPINVSELFKKTSTAIYRLFGRQVKSTDVSTLPV